MTTMTSAAAKKLGVRATAHIEGALTIETDAGNRLLAATPYIRRGVARTLNRVIGAPMTYRGATAYWVIPSTWIAD